MKQSIVINDYEAASAGQPQEERTGRLGLSQEQMEDFIKSLPDELQQKIANLDKKMGEIKTIKLEDFESASKSTKEQGGFTLNGGSKPEWAAILDMIREIKPSGNLGPEVEQRLSEMRIEYIRQLTEAVNVAERRYVGAKILKLTERRNQLSRQQEKASRPLARLISPKRLETLKRELASLDVELKQLRAEVGASTEQVPEFGAVPPKAEQGKPEQPPQAA